MNVLKTVEYSLDTYNSTVVCTTSISTTPLTYLANPLVLTIPETTGLVFKNVYLEVWWRNAHTATTTCSNHRTGLKLGTATETQLTSSGQTWVQTGEHDHWRIRHDYTQHFIDNWTGSAMNVEVRFGTTVTSTNHVIGNISGKLVITYEFDDTANDTRVKTVRLPLESQKSRLTNTLAEIGTNQIPQLTGVGGLLPEASISIKDIFFTIETNDGSNTTTNLNLGLQLDSDTEYFSASVTQGANSATAFAFIWRLTGALDPATAHAFKARSSTLTDRFGPLAIVMHVTYTYDHSTTTRILNSIMLPALDGIEAIGGPTEADATVSKRELMISEPGTLTLRQSGVFLTHHDQGSTFPRIRCGQQAAFTLYNHTAGSVQAGPWYQTHRIDSGSEGGLGLDAALTRGINNLTLRVYREETAIGQLITGMTGYWLINYESDVPAGGADRANRTISFLQRQTAPSVVGVSGWFEYEAYTPPFPTSNYYLNGYLIENQLGYSPQTWGQPLYWTGRTQSDEGGNAWMLLGGIAASGDAEVGTASFWQDAGHLFQRFAGDPTRHWKLSNGRIWRAHSYFALYYLNTVHYVTLHHIEHTISGTVSGAAGDGSGITVQVHRQDTGERVATAVTAVGGTYTTTWFNNNIPLITHAQEGSTKAGRSIQRVIG